MINKLEQISKHVVNRQKGSRRDLCILNFDFPQFLARYRGNETFASGPAPTTNFNLGTDHSDRKRLPTQGAIAG